MFDGRTVFDIIGKDARKFEELQMLIESGHTDEFVADFLGVDIKSFRAWVKEYPALKRAISRWKSVADDRVVKSLYDKAIGYSHRETKVFCNSMGDIITKDIVKYFVPDYSSISLWLRNRRRDEWKDIKDMSTKAEVSVKGQLRVGSPELQERLALLRDKVVETTAKCIEYEEDDIDIEEMLG